MPDQVIVRVYKGGNQSQAAQEFAKDAAKLAAQGYVPISQSWADNKRSGCSGCLMLIIFWPLLLLGKGGGTLTVTYRFDATHVLTTTPVPQGPLVRQCPRCNAVITVGQPACGNCGLPIDWGTPSAPLSGS